MAQNDTLPKTHYKPIFVARQPIFDRDESIWGYELLFRLSESVNKAAVDDDNLATAKVIADGFSMAVNGVDQSKKILINFPTDLILTGANQALPSDTCIVEILETVEPTEDILAACKKIKEDGYILALDDFVGQKGYEPFLEIADIVKVDLESQTPAETIKLVQYLDHYPCALLAEKVEDIKTYHLTRTLGFTYFQGFFFSRPEMMKGRKISTEKMSKIQLLHKLADENFEVKDLAHIIATDISLSYRLMKYLNSAFFAFPQKISSINQAITLLGSVHLRQWLSIVILSDMDHNDRAEEIVFTSVRRARFLELLSQLKSPPPYKQETMFLLGLFSMLDALLGQSMDEIMETMPLEDEIKAAFLGEKNNLSQWLRVAEFIDNGEWEKMDSLLSKHRLDTKQVAITYFKASTWANELLLF